MSKKKDFKWEVRELEPDRWGIFLMQEFCKTGEPVCYGAGKNKESIVRSVERMNNPDYWSDFDD
jgi:hypothetical protein